MRERIIKAVGRVSEDAVIFDGDDMLAAGIIDSFEVLDIVDELESEFGVDINPEFIIDDYFRNINAIISLMTIILEN